MTTRQSYAAKEARIVKQLRKLLAAGQPIGVAKRTSNLFRARKHSSAPKLDFTGLNQVIRVDAKAGIAEVEAATTYQDLVAATLKQGMVPAEVPQFITITVGGAVAGGACEASAFRYGPVHETVEEMTILLATGKVVTATPTNRYSDLFFAIPNTFGSLGYILKLKVKLIPAKPYVHLQHLHFTDTKQYFAAIDKIMKTNRHAGEYVDYMDGIILSPADLHLTLGRFAGSAPYTSNYKYMKMYFRSIAQRDEDYLTTHDFIWRWDADWAWGSKAFGMQNKALRLLLGKAMLNSYSYWKLVGWERKYKITKKLNRLHSKPTERVVQDIELPIEHAAGYVQKYFPKIPVYPWWVCPMGAYRPERFTFSPMNPKKHYINFGIWGTATSAPDLPNNHFNRLLEKSVVPYQGYKALYSDSFYTPEEFWKIYDAKRYWQLKDKYDPSHRLKDFYQKVCREGEWG